MIWSLDEKLYSYSTSFVDHEKFSFLDPFFTGYKEQFGMALSRDWHCKKIDYSLLTYGLTSDWKPSQWHHALTSAECLFYVITLYIGIHRVSRYTLQTGYWTSVTHQELLQLTKPFLIRLTTAVTLTDWCLMLTKNVVLTRTTSSFSRPRNCLESERGNILASVCLVLVLVNHHHYS